jgi:hypothetical protein
MTFGITTPIINGLFATRSINDSEHFDSQRKGVICDIEHYDTQHKDTQHKDTQHKWLICDTQYYSIQHNDTYHK